MLGQVKANLDTIGISESIGVALADSGYYSEANLAEAEAEGPELLIATANERDQRRGTVTGRGVRKGPHGWAMHATLATQRGRTLYAKRGTRWSRCSATSRTFVGSGGSPAGDYSPATRSGSS